MLGAQYLDQLHIPAIDAEAGATAIPWTPRAERPPLVLIPGHMATPLAWHYQIAAFAGDRHVMVPDQHYALSSIGEMARDIAPRLPRCFDLVAWSMGGYIAFELYPLVAQQVRKLVLISTSARAESEQAALRRSEFLRSIEAEGPRSAHLRQLVQGLADPFRLEAAFMERMLAERTRLGELVLRNQINAMIVRSDSRSRLGEIACPVLIIAGTRDTVTPPEYSEEIASLLPHGVLRILDDVGHCPPWEKAEDVNHMLRDFLG